MRRFDRLRRIARLRAKENGHKIGVFRPAKSISSQDIITYKALGFSVPHSPEKWMIAQCVVCDAPIWIGEHVDPNPGATVDANPLNPYLEIKAIRFARDAIKDFPVRSKGVIAGKHILEKKCEEKLF